MYRKFFASLFILAAVAGFAPGVTLTVPAGYPTIQEAIDAAVDYDEVVVADGVYSGVGNFDLDFGGKSIAVRSENGPANCEIDCQQQGRAFWFHSGEDTSSIVEGFTISDGQAVWGGAIECEGGSSPLISNCIITGGFATYDGGAIDCYNSSPTIVDCIITQNEAINNGGGIECYQSSPEIKNCLIYGNHSESTFGSAIDIYDSAPAITNCTIVDNDPYSVEGNVAVYADGLSLPVITNCILWDNGDDLEGCSAGYSCIQAGDPGPGNISDDPLFRRGPLSGGIYGSYYLSSIDASQLVKSPCVDAGTGLAVDLGLDSYTTRTDSIGDTGVVDMGYHYPDSGPYNEYQLISSVVSGNGGIAPSYPAGVDYKEFANVIFTASPDVGYEVYRWSDDGVHFTNPDNPNVFGPITVTGPRTIEVEFVQIPRYSLTAQVIGTNGTVTPNRTTTYYEGEVVELIATPSPGYIVVQWTGTDDDTITATHNMVTMDEDKVVSVEFTLIRNLLVPGAYDTIEDAVAAARDGDRIVLALSVAEPYLISDPNGIDFGGKNITLSSSYPDDPYTIANTVIDCQGSKRFPRRAFHFQSGENPSTTVIWGITIKNGFKSGAVGASGVIIDNHPWPLVAGAPRRASSGEDATGDGYAGAILCENGSSPTIKNCVFTNCIAAGGVGGDGDDGYYIPAGEDNVDGQSGGHGGNGSGEGFGGAIACLDGSSPRIIGCTFTDNVATGGWGGQGGNGSERDQDTTGNESWGGDGGGGHGDGRGGAIYFDFGCSPVITDCVFDDNRSVQAVAGSGGVAGPGGDWPAPWDDPGAQNGVDGGTATNGLIAGGAVYCDDESKLLFTSCIFNRNAAYAYGYTKAAYAYGYTKGGALYIGTDSDVNMVDCEFTENGGGAVYSDDNTDIKITNCQFVKNFNYNDSGDLPYLYDWHNVPDDWHNVPGGAIFLGLNGYADIRGTGFLENSTYSVGGAINSKGHLDITDCSFLSNSALGDSGAIDSCADPNSLLTTMQLANCTFAGNESGQFGGAVRANDFDASFDNCYFFGNIAESGGAFHLANGVADIDGGVIRKNKATGILFNNVPTVDEGIGEGIGGGIACVSTSLTVQDCTIEENTAGGENALGGAISIYGSGGIIEHSIKNCLIRGNTSDAFGGGIACAIFAIPQIENCTFSGNSAAKSGGGIFCDWSSNAQVSNSIFDSSSGFAVYEEQIGGDSSTLNCLFNDNLPGDYYNAATGLVYTGAVQINSIAGNSGNLDDDPLFVHGPRGDFYLNQDLSPAIDAGNDTAVNLGLDSLTTDSNGGLDELAVDLGYHYNPNVSVEYTLIAQIHIDGHGSLQLDPVTVGNKYVEGAIVKITAIPDSGYRVGSWSGGTIDDGSTDRVNYVIMSSDKTITIEFELPTTFKIPGDADTIQEAVGLAQEGDIVEVLPGTYMGGFIIIDKEITLRGTNPDDPSVVANTVIDGEGYFGRGVIFRSGAGEGAILNGITIANGEQASWPGEDGKQPTDTEPGNNPNGEDGGCNQGGGIYCLAGSSPTILNCVIRDCAAVGGLAGNGAAANEFNDAGRGGWGGWGRGGGVYIGGGASPVFKNVIIRNNSATGGNGGNGGDYAEDDEYYSLPGYGGLWSHDFHAPWWLLTNSCGMMYAGDYRYYSGYGGGVYCAENSSATFIGCTITENRTRGGMSGIGGIGGEREGEREDPLFSYEIPSYGGGVYCAKNSVVRFFDCTITNNVSPKPQYEPDSIEEITEPVEGGDDVVIGITGTPIYHLDPYLGHGGGVAFEETSSITFENCIISDNEASCGGGLYMANDNLSIVDCEISSNEAYQGGAIYATHGTAAVTGADFIGNFAGTIQGWDVDEVAGQGGAIYCASTEVDIFDCNIMHNEATASGGGIFLTGGDANSPSIKNCLLAFNKSGRDGGGISVNWYLSPTISNCTMFENRATGLYGGASLGGGLYVAYHSDSILIDSILWNNTADSGRQIAVATGFEFDPRPAILTVSYCDIQGGKADTASFVDSGCTLTWDGGVINEDPLFVKGLHGDFYLSQIAASHPDSIQTVDSPCVDTGSTFAGDVGMHEYVTRNDDSLAAYDKDIVDLGYHYPPTVPLEPCRFCDFLLDGIVTISDLEIIAYHWLDDCGSVDCEGSNLTSDNTVDMLDFAIFATCWLAEDNDPPKPDPAQWKLPPNTEPGSTEISMMAKIAKDTWSEHVYYQFECIEINNVPQTGIDSGWQLDDPCWVHTGLVSQTSYTYVVRVGDQWDLPNRKITEDSVEASITAGEEWGSPVPDPARFANVVDDGFNGAPVPAGNQAVTMTAATATDPEGSGIEYKFFCTTDSSFDSDWQPGPTYTATGLTIATEYCFYVIVRDTSSNNNETAQSDILCSLPGTPNYAPYPTGGAIGDAATFAIAGQPYQFANFHIMTATVAVDDEGDAVEYFFESDGGNSSGWQVSPNYEPDIGTTSPIHFSYRVKYRDDQGNESPYSAWFMVP